MILPPRPRPWLSLHPKEILERLAQQVSARHAEFCGSLSPAENGASGHAPEAQPIVEGTVQAVQVLNALLGGGQRSDVSLTAWMQVEHLARQLQSLAAQVFDALGTMPAAGDALGKLALTRILSDIHLALAELEPALPTQVDRPVVVIHADLLARAHQALFPPERMMLVAGSCRCGGIVLGDSYDVTGTGPDTHAAYVRADPDKLGKALITMSAAGRHLAAWVHSQPGSGAAATTPSQTDLDQHADWLRHYSSKLLGIILVRDGFVRFWGTAVEQNRVVIDLIGSGIEPVNRREHLYRLTG